MIKIVWKSFAQLFNDTHRELFMKSKYIGGESEYIRGDIKGNIRGNIEGSFERNVEWSIRNHTQKPQEIPRKSDKYGARRQRCCNWGDTSQQGKCPIVHKQFWWDSINRVDAARLERCTTPSSLYGQLHYTFGQHSTL